MWPYSRRGMLEHLNVTTVSFGSITEANVFGMMGREGNGAGAARTPTFAKATVTRLR